MGIILTNSQKLSVRRYQTNMLPGALCRFPASSWRIFGRDLRRAAIPGVTCIVSTLVTLLGTTGSRVEGSSRSGPHTCLRNVHWAHCHAGRVGFSSPDWCDTDAHTHKNWREPSDSRGCMGSTMVFMGPILGECVLEAPCERDLKCRLRISRNLVVSPKQRSRRDLVYCTRSEMLYEELLNR